jgi:integrase
VGVNPFIGLTRLSNTSSIREATREEAYALSDAIKSYGHPHLAIVPLVCFEWHQRPENILAGYLRWTDYRSSERPNQVRIVHHKTDEVVWYPLEENGQRFYPELEARLDELYRMGIPIVVTPGKRGTAHPYSFSYANRIVRKAARAAGIPERVTMEACRHGGLTELGDAELTEQQEMNLSGHRSPNALRRYIKKTESQRLAAIRKRRAWVLQEEHARNESQNEDPAAESEYHR